MHEPTSESPKRQPEPEWQRAAAKHAWDSFNSFKESHKNEFVMCMGAVYGAAFLKAVEMFLPPSGLVVHDLCTQCGATLIGPWDKRDSTLQLGRADGWSEGLCGDHVGANDPRDGRR